MHISLNLDWTTQVNATLQALNARGDQVLRAKAAGASTGQCLRLIETCVKPLATYPMAVAPFTPQDVAHLDRAITTLVKKCWGLPISFPNAAIHLPREEAGMGVASLQVDYIQVTTSTLTKALNDPGRLGLITRALLKAQYQICLDMDPTLL
jgi:hypothetical protein